MGKSFDVEIEASGAPEDTGIAHPAQAFIALRAVGRDAEEIPALPPQADRPQAVDQFAGGRQPSGWLPAQAVDDFAGDRLSCRNSRIAGDFHVAKPVKCEVWRECLFALAGQDVNIGCVGVAQVLAINGAIRIQNLCEAHLDRSPGGARCFQSGPSDHVLAHIKDVGAVGQRRNTHRRDHLGDASRL